jgi:hypothetical protein
MSAPLFLGSAKFPPKLASIDGGPEYRRVGTSSQAAAIYEPERLDEWALAKIGPVLRSTADGPRFRARQRAHGHAK